MLSDSPRMIPTVGMPKNSPAAATACIWLLKAPPNVIMPLNPLRLTWSMLGMSLRYLFPEISGWISSSLLTQMLYEGDT